MKLDFRIVKTIVMMVVILAVAALILGSVIVKKHQESLISEPETSTEETKEEPTEEGVTEEKERTNQSINAGNGFDKISAKKYLNENTFVQVEKICTEMTEDKNRNQELKYTCYYLSNVNLKEVSDSTFDYTACVSENAFDESKAERISFYDAFDFDYQTCSHMDDFFALAREFQGFDADMEDATYDEEKFNLIGEESYEFNGDSSIIHSMLEGETYDKLIQSTCFYSLTKTEDGIKYPSVFTAMVQYEKEDITFTKTAYLGFSFSKDEEASGCSCGTNEGCETCEEDSFAEASDCCNEKATCPSCGGVGKCTDECTGTCCN